MGNDPSFMKTYEEYGFDQLFLQGEKSGYTARILMTTLAVDGTIPESSQKILNELCNKKLGAVYCRPNRHNLSDDKTRIYVSLEDVQKNRESFTQYWVEAEFVCVIPDNVYKTLTVHNIELEKSAQYGVKQAFLEKVAEKIEVVIPKQKPLTPVIQNGYF